MRITIITEGTPTKSISGELLFAHLSKHLRHESLRGDALIHVSEDGSILLNGVSVYRAKPRKAKKEELNLRLFA